MTEREKMIIEIATKLLVAKIQNDGEVTLIHTAQYCVKLAKEVVEGGQL